jgi:uncharacterized protein
LTLSKEERVQALGLSFTVSTVARAAGLAPEHAFVMGDIRNSLFADAPALPGMGIGQCIRGRVSQTTGTRPGIAGASISLTPKVPKAAKVP